MNKSTLQRKLDRLARLNEQAQKVRSEIHDYCIDRWGKDPADLDFDDFIDGCEANGAGVGITADRFISGMDELCASEQEGSGHE